MSSIRRGPAQIRVPITRSSEEKPDPARPSLDLASGSWLEGKIVVGRKGSELLTNDAGEITRQEILLALPVACGYVEPDSQNVRSRDKARVSFLHSCGPCQLFAVSLLLLTVLSFYARFVFDGEPPEMKKKELAKRSLKRDDATQDLNRAMEIGDEDAIEKFSKRTVKVTRKHNDDCKRLLRLMGVPVVEASLLLLSISMQAWYLVFVISYCYRIIGNKAPGEAEAQCAALCENHQVYAVASEDMDSLTFGARRFLRHLIDLGYKKSPVTEFDVSKVLEELGLTMDQFIVV
ncbi:unnamed protein product [Miscanthus lutarioriparius]|uniref:XPG-I domain-containing protein n=1 Tax=Miscanthus lutarioriparius TaxID=422564 RepID=A0A811NLF9_9POAL|nr:unnamed protein product [Miscanthus lutarioriparius]